MKKIIIILVILVIVALGAYYLVFNNNSSQTPIVTPSASPSPSDQSSSTPLPTTSASTSPTPKATVANTPKPSVAAKASVSIKNLSFNPGTLTIKSGTKVTWVNNDSVSHTVTSDSGNLLNSPTLAPVQSFSFTFNKIGTINYHCNFHKTMKGVIIVTN